VVQSANFNGKSRSFGDGDFTSRGSPQQLLFGSVGAFSLAAPLKRHRSLLRFWL
jgi:hypothetical protein